MAKARQRARYSQEFKIAVVRYSLSLPPTARVKPTCRAYPGIEPVQIRKWIKAFAPLIDREASLNGGAPADMHPPRRPQPHFQEASRSSPLSDSNSDEDHGPAMLSRVPPQDARSGPSPLFRDWPAGWQQQQHHHPYMPAYQKPYAGLDGSGSASPVTVPYTALPRHLAQPVGALSPLSGMHTAPASPQHAPPFGAPPLACGAPMAPCATPAETALAAQELLCLRQGIFGQ